MAPVIVRDERMFGEAETSQAAPVGQSVTTKTGTANFEEEAKPETVVERVKQVNEKIGENGSVDLEPLVNLGRSIWAEGHQNLEAFTARAKELLSDVWEKVKYHIDAAWKILNNERGSVSMEPMTTPKGTADIPAKTTPQAEAGLRKWFGASKVVDESGKPLKVYHGTPMGEFVEFDDSHIGDRGLAAGERRRRPRRPRARTAGRERRPVPRP